MEEKVIELLIIGSVIVLFVILGMIFMNGKGAFLIAGYNTMPPEEKEKYDTIALTKFMGKMMFALSFSMLFWVFSMWSEVDWLFYLGLVLFFGIVGFMLIYVNTGNRFKKS